MKGGPQRGGDAGTELEGATHRDSEVMALFAQLDGDDLAVDGLVGGLSVLDFC
jgi:hypothetical protein